jgi:uncharacterized protein (TIGR02231 family)
MPFMSRRTIPFALLLAFISSASIAQTRTRVTINEATVFLRGAQLTSSANVNIPIGESEFLFTNIAGNINQNSINVGTLAEVAVQSVVFKNDYLGDSSISPRVRVLNDSIAFLERRRAPISDEKQVVLDQLETLRANRDLSSGKGGLTTLELQKLLDLVGQRTDALLRRHRSLDSQDAAFSNRISLLQAQVGQEQRKGFQPGGALLVRFYSQKPVTTKVNISYVTPNAGWAPAYDLRVEKVNAPVRLFYKAQVYQNSGVKWDKVQLLLSTGNPTEGAEAPVFSAQYLEEQPVLHKQRVGNA